MPVVPGPLFPTPSSFSLRPPPPPTPPRLSHLPPPSPLPPRGVPAPAWNVCRDWSQLAAIDDARV